MRRSQAQKLPRPRAHLAPVRLTRNTVTAERHQESALFPTSLPEFQWPHAHLRYSGVGTLVALAAAMRNESRNARYARVARLSIATVAFGLLAMHCGSAPSEEASAGDPEALSGACSFSVTTNSYDGPNYWGTIAVKNTGSAGVTGFTVAFDVPSGAQCTSDAVPSGAKLTASANHGSVSWATT